MDDKNHITLEERIWCKKLQKEEDAAEKKDADKDFKK